MNETAGYLPLRRLAGYAGLSVRRLRQYLHDPVTPLPHYRIGGKILVRQTDYDLWAGRFRADRRANVDRTVDEVMRGLV